MMKTFKHIFECARSLGIDICIAGGSVVDYKQATDIDVFVLGLTHEIENALLLADRLDPRYVNHGGPSIASQYDDERLHIATCWPFAFDKPVQVLTTTHCTALELIESFDISTHAWAIESCFLTGLRPVYSADRSTTLKETPVVNRLTTPNATYARLMKICNRYTLAPRDVDVKNLTHLSGLEIHANQEQV